MNGRIVVAPTSYKGTISARDAAEAIAAGAMDAGLHDVILAPLSDGGPGLIDALSFGSSEFKTVKVAGPLGGVVEARIMEWKQAAVIESADACGLHLTGQRRDPLSASTFGVGQLIKHAAEVSNHVIVGLGGSATVDGGLGAARATGWRFLRSDGSEIEVPGDLLDLHQIEEPVRRFRGRITALADVTSLATGESGAARIFGPQKGASPADVERLDEGLSHLFAVWTSQSGFDVRRTVGGGAAGGLGAGLAAFFGADLVKGADWVMAEIGFDASLSDADVVVTGEGSYDEQSELGKITGEVVRRARNRGIPAVIIAGRVSVPLPDGVVGVHQSGILDVDALRRIAADALPRLLGSGHGR